MDLVGQFMRECPTYLPRYTTYLLTVGRSIVHAAIEEYLLNGAYGDETFNTIFAFGCPKATRRPDDGSDIDAMRTLFCSEGRPHEQIAGWEQVKRRYIEEVGITVRVTDHC